MQSEMAFKKETELCEEYPERKVFQLSFCMNGICEWDYRQKRGEHYQLPLHSAAYSVELFPNASAVLVLKNLTEH